MSWLSNLFGNSATGIFGSTFGSAGSGPTTTTGITLPQSGSSQPPIIGGGGSGGSGAIIIGGANGGHTIIGGHINSIWPVYESTKSVIERLRSDPEFYNEIAKVILTEEFNNDLNKVIGEE